MSAIPVMQDPSQPSLVSTSLGMCVGIALLCALFALWLRLHQLSRAASASEYESQSPAKSSLLLGLSSKSGNLGAVPVNTRTARAHQAPRCLAEFLIGRPAPPSPTRASTSPDSSSRGSLAHEPPSYVASSLRPGPLQSRSCRSLYLPPPSPPPGGGSSTPWTRSADRSGPICRVSSAVLRRVSMPDLAGLLSPERRSLGGGGGAGGAGAAPAPQREAELCRVYRDASQESVEMASLMLAEYDYDPHLLEFEEYRSAAGSR